MGNSVGRRAAAVIVALAAASALFLSACSAPPADLVEPAVAAASPTPMVTEGMSISAVPTPRDTCEALIDINSLISNERFALDQGRVAEQEYEAFNRLVGRLVLRIDTSNRSVLASAVEQLQTIVGPYRMGAMTMFDPTTKQWTDAFAVAQAECEDAGVEFYVEAWVGG